MAEQREAELRAQLQRAMLQLEQARGLAAALLAARAIRRTTGCHSSNLKRLRRLAILILQYWFLEAGLSIGELVPSAWQKSMFLLLIFSRLILILKYHFCLCEILVERRGPEWLAEFNTGDCHFPLLFIDIDTA